MAKTLVSYCGSAKEVFKKNKSQLAKLPGFGTFYADKVLNFKKFSKAEEEIAESFERASEHYKNNQAALHLRAMNMVFEGLKKKGSMIIVPSTAVETMGLGAMGGLTAFDRILGRAGDDSEKETAPPPKDTP